MNISGLWDLKKLKVRVALSSGLVLEVKDGLDRTGKKIRLKMAKIACTGMCHQMHFLDLLRWYVFWTAGLTTGRGI